MSHIGQRKIHFISFVGFCFSSAWGGVSANKVHVLAEILGFLGLREAVPRDR